MQKSKRLPVIQVTTEDGLRNTEEVELKAMCCLPMGVKRSEGEIRLTPCYPFGILREKYQEVDQSVATLSL